MSKNAPLYEKDFVRWTEAQAANLRRAGEARTDLPLDWDNLAEEVESLGRSQRRELRSSIAVIIEHLLKLDRSPAEEPRAGWIETIGGERREIERLLEDSPSLRGELGRLIAIEWPRTAKFVEELLTLRGEASRGAPSRDTRPSYTVEQVLGAWIPEPPATTP